MKTNKVLLTVKIVFALALASCLLVPVYIMVVNSFKPVADVFDGRLIPLRFSTDGYDLVAKHNFHIYFFNSLLVSVSVTVVALLFHSMAGYALARLEFPGRRAVFLWILSTLMIPFSVIMIPLFILVKRMGMLNSYAGMIVPAIPHAYGIFLFRQFFLTIPKELEEAAEIDGCSPFATYLRIFLPLSKSISITLAVAFFIANWNSYIWPLVVNQDQSKWVLQVAIADFIGRNDSPWNAIMAAGVIAVLPTIALFFVLQRYLVEGVKMSGLKS
ncbi:MAG: carbohydrate ABC transporter permease [Christensenellaceae bacterium]|nr:carbohydrate ABC transporter permease [Christensenellaceae bacterium]